METGTSTMGWFDSIHGLSQGMVEETMGDWKKWRYGGKARTDCILNVADVERKELLALQLRTIVRK